MVRRLFMLAVLCAASFISSSALAVALPPEAIARSAALTSIFENSTTILQYCYIENIHDGRGYTAGIGGFTTATGDLLDTVDEFLKSGSDPLRDEWRALRPLLESRWKNGDGSTNGLHRVPTLWKKSCKFAAFKAAEDTVVEKLYRIPAQQELDRLGFKSPLAFAIIFDSVIQHGFGGGDDSYQDILAQMAKHNAGDERDFANKFLVARRAILMNPKDEETREAWRESVGRIDALEDLVHRGLWDLPSGTRVVVWGHSFKLP